MSFEVGSLIATLQVSDAEYKRRLDQAGMAWERTAQRIGATDPTASIPDKMLRLSSSIELQKRQLGILEQELAKVAAKYNQGSVQVQRKQLAIDRLNSALGSNERRLASYQTALGETQQNLNQVATAATKAADDGVRRLDDALAGMGGSEAVVITLQLSDAEYKQRLDQAGAEWEKTAQRIEATDPAAAIVDKMQRLAASIELQKRQLTILEKELPKVAAKYGETSLQVQRKQLAIERLSTTISNNEKRLASYQDALERTRLDLENVDEAASKASSGGLSRMDAVLAGMAGGAAVGVVNAGLEVLGETVQRVMSGLADGARDGMAFNASLETTTAQLLAITKSGDQTASILADVREEAIEARIPFAALAQAATDLAPAARVANVPLEELIETAEVLAAIRPQEGLEGAAFALREALSGDYVSIVERFNLPRQYLNQLKEEGVPAVEAVRRAMQEMGYDTDLVAGIADTASGRWRAFQGILAMFQGQMMEPTFEVFKEGLGDALDMLEANDEEVERWARDVGTHLGAAAETARELIEDVDWRLLGRLIKEAAEEAEELVSNLDRGARWASALVTPVAQYVVLTKAIQETVEALEAQGRAQEANRIRGSMNNPLDPALEQTIKLIERTTGAYEIFADSVQENGEAYGLLDSNLGQLAGTLNAIEDQMDSGFTNDFTIGLGAAADEAARLDSALNRAIQGQLNGGFVNDFEIDTPPDAEGEKMLNDLYERRADLLDDLADEYSSYEARVASIQERLAEGERAYQEAVADAQADRAEAIQDAADRRHAIETKLAEELADLEKDHQAELADIRAARLEADQEAAEARGEIEAELLADLADLEAEHQAELADLRADRIAADEEAAQARGEIEAEFLEEVADLEREYQEDQAERAREHTEKLADLQRDLAREIEDTLRDEEERQRDHFRALEDLARDYADARADIEDDIARQQDRYADAAEDRARRLQDTLDDIAERQGEDEDRLAILKEIEELLASAPKGTDGDLIRSADREKLAELQRQLAAIDALYEAERLKAERRAAEEEARERAKHEKALAELERRLAEEAAEYERRKQRLEEEYAWETEENQRKHERAVQDLQERIQRETDAYARQEQEATARRERELADLRAQHDKELADVQTKHDATLEKLATRLAEENAAYDEQRADLQAKAAEELAEVQAKHDEAVAKLATRLAEENAAYDEQRADLQAKAAQELADVQAKLAERLTKIEAHLADVTARHDRAQADLRRQLADTTKDHQTRLDELARAWEGPLTAIEKYEEALRRLQEMGAQPLPFVITADIDDVIEPHSPSPLEQSLTRTLALRDELAAAPFVATADIDAALERLLSGELRIGRVPEITPNTAQPDEGGPVPFVPLSSPPGHQGGAGGLTPGYLAMGDDTALLTDLAAAWELPIAAAARYEAHLARLAAQMGQPLTLAIGANIDAALRPDAPSALIASLERTLALRDELAAEPFLAVANLDQLLQELLANELTIVRLPPELMPDAPPYEPPGGVAPFVPPAPPPGHQGGYGGLTPGYPPPGNTYHFTANYGHYQAEPSLRDDLRLLMAGSLG